MEYSEKEEFLQFCSSTLDEIFEVLKERYEKYGNITDILDGVHNVDNHINGEIISKANRALASVKKFRADIDYKGRNNKDSFIDIMGYTLAWMWIIKSEEPEFFSQLKKDDFFTLNENNCGN